MQPGGQSLVDRLLAAKNTIAGQALAKVTCKATTEEIMGPKRKHLECKRQKNRWKQIFELFCSFLFSSSSSSYEWNECFNPSIGWFADWTYTKLLLGCFIQSSDHYPSFNVFWEWSKYENKIDEKRNPKQKQKITFVCFSSVLKRTWLHTTIDFNLRRISIEWECRAVICRIIFDVMQIIWTKNENLTNWWVTIFAK